MVHLNSRTIATLVFAILMLVLVGILFKQYSDSSNSSLAVGPSSSSKTIVESNCLTGDCSNESESLSASISEVGSVFAASSNESYEISTENTGFSIEEECLRCICLKAAACLPAICSNGELCGIYRISEPYWIDAGRLTVPTEVVDSATKDDYKLCVNDKDCASRSVNAYMKKYARDCDGNGKIDCIDYTILHMLGPSGCLRYNQGNNDGLESFACATVTDFSYDYEGIFD